jgi:mRNA interferase RelE/StbE
MDEFSIIFTRSARKELEALDATIVRRIFPQIEALAREPRPRACRKLQGEENLWRIRIGDYRVIYAIYDQRQEIDIIAIRHRREAYR